MDQPALRVIPTSDATSSGRSWFEVFSLLREHPFPGRVLMKGPRGSGEKTRPGNSLGLRHSPRFKGQL